VEELGSSLQTLQRLHAASASAVPAVAARSVVHIVLKRMRRDDCSDDCAEDCESEKKKCERRADRFIVEKCSKLI